MYYSSNSIKLTHIPSGETVIASLHRSQHKNRNLALKIIRSRLWAINNGFPRPIVEDDSVYDYEFEDDINYHDELDNQRTKKK